MTLEDAKYYSLLILMGDYEEFDKMIRENIESQEELSEIVAELLYVSDDKRKSFDILNKYHLGKNVNDDVVAARIIEFVKNKLQTGEYDRIKAIDFFIGVANSVFASVEEKKEPWITMSLFRYINNAEGEAFIFNSDLDNFLERGTTLTDDK